MRHVILTCKNHPRLRWSCKECAVNQDGSYNGSRSIFFNGVPSGRGMYQDGSGLHCTKIVESRDAEGKITDMQLVEECTCGPGDLTFAPEDALVSRV